MSWNFCQENQLNVYGREFNAKSIFSDSIVSEVLDTTTLNALTVVSDKLQTTAGGNYLGLWSSLKTYKLGDQVIFNNLVYRCLVDNTTLIPPDPNNPAQAEWVPLTSNNAVKNDIKYIQVSDITGDDSKALISPVPFKTIQAALTFGGNDCQIVLIDAASTFNLTSSLSISNKQNITIDGRVKSQYSTYGNTIQLDGPSGVILIGNCNQITIKNLIIKSSATFSSLYPFMALPESTNITFENVIFDLENVDSSYEILIGGVNPILVSNDLIFNSCRMKVVDNTKEITIQNDYQPSVSRTKSTRVIIKDCIGPVNYKQTFTYDNISSALETTIITNCTLNGCTHRNGTFIINNCQALNGLWQSVASNIIPENKFIVLDSSTQNFITGVYNNLNKAGSCTYYFKNFDWNRDTYPVNGTGSDISAGPASYFNQLTSFGTPGAATLLSINLTNTADKLNIPTLVSDPFDILGTVSTNSFIINYTGLYYVDLNVETATTTTTGQDGIIDIFINLASTSDISTAFARNTTYRGLVNNSTTYPTNNALISFILPWPSVNVAPLSIYGRNTNGQQFNIQIVKMLITRVRKI